MAAISTYCTLVDGRSLFLVWLKGLRKVYQMCIPVRDPVTSWNLNLVFAMLVKLPFEAIAECSFYCLSITMAFIIDTLLARRVRELNTFMADPPFTSFYKDKIL